MHYHLEWSKGNWNRERSSRANNNHLRNQDREKIGHWRSVRRKKSGSMMLWFRLHIFWLWICICEYVYLICSFCSLLWMFFNTKVSVNSSPSSQSSQTSSGLVSKPKKQLLCPEARLWRFLSCCLWWIFESCKVEQKMFWKILLMTSNLGNEIVLKML